jgi:hypothetical protein
MGKARSAEMAFQNSSIPVLVREKPARRIPPFGLPDLQKLQVRAWIRDFHLVHRLAGPATWCLFTTFWIMSTLLPWLTPSGADNKQ